MSGKLITIERIIRRRIRRALAEGRDLVVELHPYGIKLRQAGRRGRRIITWAELLRHFPEPAADRRSAFDRDAAPGWVPARGERVWVCPGVSRYTNGVVLSVIDAVGGPIATVAVGDKNHTRQFRLWELRPMNPKPKGKP